MKDVYKVLENFASDALIDKDEYIKMYNESINDSEGFWKKHAKRINWIKNFSKVKDISVGDNIAYGGMPIGSYAEEILYPTEKLIKLPEGINFDIAATTAGAPR